MIRSAPAVRQSAMVTCHRKGREGLFCLHTFKGTGGGVIHRLSAGQAALEGVGIFPQIVGQAGQPALCLCTKGSGKGGASVCSPFR